MPSISRIVSISLLLMVATSWCAGVMWALPVAHPAAPGCHKDDGAPQPQPVSYQCCISGHRHALAAGFFTGVMLIASAQIGDIHSFLPQITADFFPSASLSPSPPGLFSLRI